MIHCYRLQNRTYFNPRSPYGERHPRAGGPPQTLISIHAPLTGSDQFTPKDPPITAISIHAPLTGSDNRPRRWRHPLHYFNPRSPYGERPGNPVPYHAGAHFNPRSPYGERLLFSGGNINGNIFQSTLPLRGATGCIPQEKAIGYYFNPRSPYGERHADDILPGLKHRFQSTLPLRGATRRVIRQLALTRFQSTLPLRGATSGFISSAVWALFQSTLPLRGATSKDKKTHKGQ